MARPVDPAKGSRFLILASVCVVVAALYFAQEVFIPLALAVLFCFLLAPLVRKFERWGLGRVPAVVVVVLGALAIIGGLTYVVSSQVVRLVKEEPQYRNNIVKKWKALRGSGSGGFFHEATDHFTDLSKELSKEPTTQPASSPVTVPAVNDPGSWRDVLDALRKPAVPPEPKTGETPVKPVYTREVPEPESPLHAIFGNIGVVLAPLGTFGLVLVIVVFMLMQREDLRDRLIRLTGKGQIHVTTNALDDAGSRISRYLIAQSLINASYGLLIAGGLWLIGRLVGRDEAGQYLPFPTVIVWGLLCGVLRFIPYIGPWIGAAFPLALSVAVYPHNGPAFATLGYFVVIELLCANVLEPLLYGTSTGMSSVAILVAAVFWTWLWGPVGLLLATPLTVILVVIGKYVPQLQFLDIMLGDEPVMEPHARLYQRLLATDQEEATELAMQYARERPLEEVYGTILIPALSLVEQDRHRGRLDADRQAFIHQAMRDIVDEVWDHQRVTAERDAATQLKQAAADTVLAARKGSQPLEDRAGPSDAGGNGSTGDGNGNGVKGRAPPAVFAQADASNRPTLPTGCTVRIALLPAHDDADDIAAVMLGQLLELRGYCVFPMSVTKLASEMIESVEKNKADIVIVSAMPPAAVTHSRYLCKRLHSRFGTIEMLVGLWTSRGDIGKARERITCEQSVTVVTTFSDALDRVQQAAQPIIVRAAAASA